MDQFQKNMNKLDIKLGKQPGISYTAYQKYMGKLRLKIQEQVNEQKRQNSSHPRIQDNDIKQQDRYKCLTQSNQKTKQKRKENSCDPSSKKKYSSFNNQKMMIKFNSKQRSVSGKRKQKKANSNSNVKTPKVADELNAQVLENLCTQVQENNIYNSKIHYYNQLQNTDEIKNSNSRYQSFYDVKRVKDVLKESLLIENELSFSDQKRFEQIEARKLLRKIKCECGEKQSISYILQSLINKINILGVKNDQIDHKYKEQRKENLDLIRQKQNLEKKNVELQSIIDVQDLEKLQELKAKNCLKNGIDMQIIEKERISQKMGVEIQMKEGDIETFHKQCLEYEKILNEKKFLLQNYEQQLEEYKNVEFLSQQHHIKEEKFKQQINQLTIQNEEILYQNNQKEKKIILLNEYLQEKDDQYQHLFNQYKRDTDYIAISPSKFRNIQIEDSQNYQIRAFEKESNNLNQQQRIQLLYSEKEKNNFMIKEVGKMKEILQGELQKVQMSCNLPEETSVREQIIISEIKLIDQKEKNMKETEYLYEVEIDKLTSNKKNSTLKSQESINIKNFNINFDDEKYMQQEVDRIVNEQLIREKLLLQ